MNDKLIKSYDLVKEEQRNADSKANLFIVLITAVISFFGKIPSSMIDVNDITGYQQLLFLMILPLLMLVLSLVPIYRIKVASKNKAKKENKLNLFYWETIVGTGTYDDFKKEYVTIYEVKSSVSVEDEHLLEQIFKNADIMHRKASIHKIAFTIIIQFILLFLTSGVTVLVFNSSTTAFWWMLIAYELAIYVPFRKLFLWIKTDFIQQQEKDSQQEKLKDRENEN